MSLRINARAARTPHISLLFFYIPDTCYNSVRAKTYRSPLLKSTLSETGKNIYILDISLFYYYENYALYQCYVFYAKYACNPSGMMTKTTNAQNVSKYLTL